jgi:hypothetical protein
MKLKRTILYVDNDASELSSMKVFLESRGYVVLTCCDGEQAKRVYLKYPVDLLVVAMRTVFDSTWAACPTVFVQGLNRMALLERVRIGVLRKRGSQPHLARLRPKPHTEPHALLLVGKQAEMRARSRRRT